MVSENDYILKFAGDKKSAQKLGAFYTPPSLGRRMVDKVSQSFVGKKCLDNACGYGNLILQMLDAKVRQGEDPTKALTEVYGNEFDAGNLEICMRNLKIWARLNGAKWINAVMTAHFHTGDALTAEAYEFEDPDVDIETARDENDIEKILRKPDKTKPEKTTVAMPKRPSSPERKSSEKTRSAAEKQAGKTVIFRIFTGGYSLSAGDVEKTKNGTGLKFNLKLKSILEDLAKKGISVKADLETIKEWKMRQSLLDFECSAEIDII